MAAMTSRERMLRALRNEQPDRIPAAPDISNMIPCRLTGRPFWHVYLYHDPPLWQAYMDAVAYFGMDGWLHSVDGFYLSDPAAPPAEPSDEKRETVIVARSEERIVTRSYTQRRGQGKEWAPNVTVYPGPTRPPICQQ